MQAIILCQHCVTNASSKVLKMIHLSSHGLFKPSAPSKQNTNNVYTQLGIMTVEPCVLYYARITNGVTLDLVVAPHTHARPLYLLQSHRVD